MPEQIPLMVDAATQELRQFASDETIPKGQLLAALQVALTGLGTSDGSGVLESDTILQALGKLQAQASNKVDKVAGKQLSTEDFTSDDKTKLSGIAAGATANATDTDLRDRTTHTGTQPITTITGVVGTMAGGSIIERGENANGEYVKFADGTQICTRSVTGYTAGTTHFAFAAGFFLNPAPSVSVIPAEVWAFPEGFYADLGQVHIEMALASSANTLVMCAIGRWK